MWPPGTGVLSGNRVVVEARCFFCRGGSTLARGMGSIEAIEAQPWLGSRPCFADSRPVIGRAPGQPSLWLDYGHAHWGLTLGPASGRLIAEMITGAEPFCDPAPYAAERFAA